MEDAERIIFENLQQVGCTFDAESLKDIDTEHILEAVVKCLKVIIPDFSAPAFVPHNMVAKYNLGMKLAEAIGSLGFKGELGYQSFMYSNEVELRRIFTFLIEKLPKEEKASPVQSTDFSFKSAFSAALRTEIEKPWLPVYARDDLARIPYHTVNAEHFATESDRNVFLTSLLAANATLQAKISLPTDKEFACLVDLIQDKKDTAEQGSSMPDDTQQTDAELEIDDTVSNDSGPDESELLEERCYQLSVELREVDRELEKITNEMINVHVALESLESTLKAERESAKIKLKAHELIDQHGLDGAFRVCEEYLSNLESKSSKHATEWEQHRAPLVDSLRKLRMENSSKWSQQKSKRERLERLETDKNRMIQEYTSKKELVKQLQAEWEKLNHRETNVTLRSSYLSRIREIVSSVSRQKEEIEKILIDNRKKQREMNLLADRLERSFAAADLFFAKQAVKMDDAKRMQRHIGDIHKDCKTIFEAVESHGTIQRDTRELQERIEKERESNIEENLARISADYGQMRYENDAIETELTKKGVTYGRN